MALSRRFELVGGRELVNKIRAEELIAQAKIESPTLLRLSNKSFDFEAAELIAATLNTFTQVTIADLSDIIAGRPELEALKVLKAICDSLHKCNLLELNLSDNALGSKGVHACHSVLSLKTIEKLWINNNGMAAESVELLHSVFAEGGHYTPLKLLHFYNNMAGDGGAKAMGEVVKNCPQLEDFRFSATRAGNEGCLAVAEGMGVLSGLVHLDLADGNFSKQAGVALSVALTKQLNLQTLILRDANMGSAGVISALEAVCLTNTNSSGSRVPLKKLDISGNELSAKGWRRLSQLLVTPALIELTELKIDESELDSEVALTVFAPALRKLSRLKMLSLCHCELHPAGALGVAMVVGNIAAFEELKIDGNSVSGIVVARIQTLLNSNNKILTAMEENDEDGEDDTDEFEEALALLQQPELERNKAASNETDVNELAEALAQTKLDK